MEYSILNQSQLSMDLKKKRRYSQSSPSDSVQGIWDESCNGEEGGGAQFSHIASDTSVYAGQRYTQDFLADGKVWPDMRKCASRACRRFLILRNICGWN